VPEARRFPPPWSIEESSGLLHRARPRQAGAGVCLLRVPRRASGPESVFRRGSRSLLFQLIELLFERGKARHELAIGLVAGRFFLN
jgi:hypothetical protein